MKVPRIIRARLKTRQKWGRCPGCGGRTTDSHHLFVRRQPDHPSLYEDWNMVMMCNKCHMEEREWTQIKAALQKLQVYGSAYIEDKVAALPFKIKPALPKFYWKAKLMCLRKDTYRPW